MIFFRMGTLELTLVIYGLLLGATAIGLWIGRTMRSRAESLRDSFSVVQGALFGFMALVLAFGLSLSVGRYEARRVAVVAEANAIGTTYLRAQTLEEPVRTQSLRLLEQYTDDSIGLSKAVPGSAAQAKAVAVSGELQRRLWSLAGQALDAAPVASAPRLYVESLNEMFDAQTARVAGLGNRVPTTVLALEVLGAAIALGMLATHLAVLGRGVFSGVLAAVLIGSILLVTFDLDRPTRGLIRVPSSALDRLRTSYEAGPAAIP